MTLDAFELEPTRENLLLTLEQNLIGRNKDVWQFARFCNIQDKSCSIAIDADWGFGKTFFVKQVKMVLEAFNDHTTAITETEKAKIKELFSKETDTDFEPAVCIYYDAWSNDNDTDPILSLVYEIAKEAARDDSFKKGLDFDKTATLLIDQIFKLNTTELLEEIRKGEKSLLSGIKEQRDINAVVGEFLGSFLPERGNRLVVFIDELDRCKPSYAVQLLERVKHYYTDDRITFVFSINSKELQHTIKHFYGDEFDAGKYLNRFFDYQISLPPAEMSSYYKIIGLENNTYVYETVCKAACKTYGFGLRTLVQFWRSAKIAAYKPTHNSQFLSFHDDNGVKFALCIVVPIMIALRISDFSQYSDFIDGKNPQPLIDVIGSKEFGERICSGLLNRDETYYEEEKDKKKVIALPDKLKEMYKAIFDDNYKKNSWEEITVGEYTFSAESKEVLLRAVSFMSEYADLEQ